MDTMVSDFYKPNNGEMNGNVDRAIRNAHRAVCGVAERETLVKTVNVPKIIKGLQSRGYNVIGTSYERPGTKTKKIWFVQQGMGSL